MLLQPPTALPKLHPNLEENTPSCFLSRPRDRSSRPGKCHVASSCKYLPNRFAAQASSRSHTGKICEASTSVPVRIPGFGRQIHVFVWVTVSPCVHFPCTCVSVSLCSQPKNSKREQEEGDCLPCVLRQAEKVKGGQHPCLS